MLMHLFYKSKECSHLETFLPGPDLIDELVETGQKCGIHIEDVLKIVLKEATAVNAEFESSIINPLTSAESSMWLKQCESIDLTGNNAITK